MREDGTRLDKLVFTQDSAFSPSGTGPATDSAVVTYRYDALGRRVQKHATSGPATTYACAGAQVLSEYTDGVIAQSYVYGMYVDEPLALIDHTDSDAVYFYHRNHLYSVAAITNNAGGIVERYGYDAYGQRETVVDNAPAALEQAYGFTGRRLDGETGLWYFRNRQFDSNLGRFLSRDFLGYVDGLNLLRAYFLTGTVDPFGTTITSVRYSRFTDFDQVNSKVREALNSAINSDALRSTIYGVIVQPINTHAEDVTGLKWNCDEGDDWKERHRRGKRGIGDRNDGKVCKDVPLSVETVTFREIGTETVGERGIYHKQGFRQYNVWIEPQGEIRASFRIPGPVNAIVCCCESKDGSGTYDRIMGVADLTPEIKLEYKGDAAYSSTTTDWAGAAEKLLSAVLSGAMSALRGKAEEKANEYLEDLGITSSGESE